MSREPIIDMHLHAYPADAFGQGPVPLCVPLSVHPEADCADPILSPPTDEELVRQTKDVLTDRNIFGVLSGAPAQLQRWLPALGDRVIGGVEFQLADDRLEIDVLRRVFEDGRAAVFGEILNQYAGIAPDDERMEPYWDLAEELDLPVTIHMGEGPPGCPYGAAPRYRARLGNPLLLEDVLVRHPQMRVCVMHYGSPFVDEMIAVMYSHPQVYVELGGIQWAYPREFFYSQLQRFVDAGFGNRVMFGSDQMIWPGVIGHAIAVVEEAPFLTEGQKRDIFYNNAVRFLRLGDDGVARHHKG